MTACDITGPCAQNALVAVNEAIANAMEHACANGSEGTVHITARATVDRLFIEVADTGIWWEPESRCRRTSESAPPRTNESAPFLMR
ncbi:ATP-binding protein [Streptomyces californicus]|uniref:ATP-binding protein n=1 Tax=Streptomyces californicus TaxID=67351 RepID=UPI00296ECA85|nr:ATP-binding protein [Streptomyces californicus]MDW4918950.1 ATP-binding protein [Streptomyces californicus]